MTAVDFDVLREKFRAAKSVASSRARWAFDDPSLPRDTCRYCGRYWRPWAGTQFDGHAACTVTIEFKQLLRDLLQSPLVTYEIVADAIGVSDRILRTWTFPARRSA